MRICVKKTGYWYQKVPGSDPKNGKLINTGIAAAFVIPLLAIFLTVIMLLLKQKVVLAFLINFPYNNPKLSTKAPEAF